MTADSPPHAADPPLPAPLRRTVGRRYAGPPLQAPLEIIHQRLSACRGCQRFNGRNCRLVAGCGAIESWATRILYGCRNRRPRS